MRINVKEAKNNNDINHAFSADSFNIYYGLKFFLLEGLHDYNFFLVLTN